MVGLQGTLHAFTNLELPEKGSYEANILDMAHDTESTSVALL